MLTHPPQVRSVQELVPLVPLGSGSREAISRSGKREGRREIKHLLLYMSFRPVIPVIHYICHYARNLTGISGVTYIKKSIDLAWSSLTGISGVTYIKNLPLRSSTSIGLCSFPDAGKN